MHPKRPHLSARLCAALLLLALLPSMPGVAQARATAERFQPPLLSPASTTLAINGMTTGLLFSSAFVRIDRGLVYHPTRTTNDVHGGSQWPLMLGGLGGGVAGLGIGMASQFLVPPVNQTAMVHQSFAHLAIPLGLTGAMIFMQPSSDITGFFALAGTTATLPISYLLANEPLNDDQLRNGNLLALNLGIAAGSLCAALSSNAEVLGLTALEERPVDVSVGSFLLAGTIGMLAGPLSQTLVPEERLEQTANLYWGGMVGSAAGWIVGLTARALWGQNEYSSAAAAALVGQTAGLLTGALLETEE